MRRATDRRPTDRFLLHELVAMTPPSPKSPAAMSPHVHRELPSKAGCQRNVKYVRLPDGETCVLGSSARREPTTEDNVDMPQMDRSEALGALVEEYGALDALISALDHEQLMLPSGCRDWSNKDLVFHLLHDAQRSLVTFNSPAEGPSDTDFISYWSGFQASDEGSQVHARFVRTSAKAYADPTKLCARWHDTARAATHCAKAADQIEYVSTQGHVLRTPDFMATLAVEAGIHHLDLLASLGGGYPPASSALAIATKTLEALLEQPIPADWDDVTFILKATGRQALSESDQETLGVAARKLPLFS